MELLRRATAEAIGAFALVFAGCGAIMVNAESGALGSLGIAAVFGLAIMAMIFAVGHISGAHFNPAVSLAFAVTRRLSLRELGAYWIGQASGAILAAVLLVQSLGDVAHAGATLPGGSTMQAFGWEVALTFFLMFVIMAVATDDRAVGTHAAIAVGGTVAFGSLAGGSISGASMNPARSLGPALASGELSQVWIYLLAPAIGALAGALAYEFVRGERPHPGEIR